MHVDEAVHVRVAVRGGPGLPELLQRVRPERGERQQPPGRQHPPELAQHLVRVVAPLQHQVAEDQLRGPVSERQPRRVAADPGETAQQGLPAAGFQQHAHGQVERGHPRAGIATLQGQRARTCARSDVEHDARLQPHEVEPLQVTTAHLGLQHRDGVVAAGRLAERAPDPCAVQQELRVVVDRCLHAVLPARPVAVHRSRKGPSSARKASGCDRKGA